MPRASGASAAERESQRTSVQVFRRQESFKCSAHSCADSALFTGHCIVMDTAAHYCMYIYRILLIMLYNPRERAVRRHAAWHVTRSSQTAHSRGSSEDAPESSE